LRKSRRLERKSGEKLSPLTNADFDRSHQRNRGGAS
jgi:hypothetical protein